jgi:hypothetical protein
MTPASTSCPAPPGRLLGVLENEPELTRQLVAALVQGVSVASIIAVWPSWPQACMTPGFCEGELRDRFPPGSATRVDVSARSAERLAGTTGAQVRDDAGLRRPFELDSL